VDVKHSYEVSVEWHGNRGTGTSDYRAYGRDHTVSAANKTPIAGSADRAFRGDIDHWNPEELLLAALSQCHMLSYLHVATMHGVVVTAYTDDSSGVMEQTTDGGGHFVSATLRPVVTIEGGADPAAQKSLAAGLHAEASAKCFIAASVNFPVGHEPTTLLAS
jgi:organic hydroperoxide reductase OsmC/OhrA